MSTASLGTVLLVLGAGSLLSMQLSGVAIDRVGSGRFAFAGAAGMAVAVLLPLLASNFWQFAASAFVFGGAIGCTEVAMNSAAVDTERAYGRPIMSAFHGVFSVGNVVGAAVAAVGYGVGASVVAATASAVALCAVIVTAAAFVLLRSPYLRPDGTGEVTVIAAEDSARLPIRPVAVLGTLTFLLLLCEGSAMDWSSLHAQQHLGSDSTGGALAFGAFVGAMTVGRFCSDTVVERIGTVNVVRWGTAVAAAGILVVYVAPSLPVVSLGWILFGLGLSGTVPQVLTAAGNISDASGRALSRVVGIGYLAILAGPGLIGWIADATSLHTALLLPLGAVIVCCVAAGAVSRSPFGTDPSR